MKIKTKGQHYVIACNIITQKCLGTRWHFGEVWEMASQMTLIILQ